MRRDNPFKDKHMVLGELSQKALEEGVVVRPYSAGVVVHVEKRFSGTTLRIDGEDHDCCFRSVVPLIEDLHELLKSGTYKFLWHYQGRGGGNLTYCKAKQALLGQITQVGYVLSPLTKDGEIYQTLEDMKLKKWSTGKTNKIKLLKWFTVKGPGDFKYKTKTILDKGFTSFVARVGNKDYRVANINEGCYTIVDFIESKRWGEVEGILVKVPGKEKLQPVKLGLEKHDRQEMYRSPNEFLNSKALIIYDGLTTRKTLKNPKVRALKVELECT